MGWIRFLLWCVASVLCGSAALFVVKDESKLNKVVKFWARCLLWISQTRYEIQWRVSKQDVVALETAIVVSNHQSYVDIPLLELVFPKLLYMVAKKELRWFPIFGQAAWLAGVVMVDRKRRGRSNIRKPMHRLFSQKKWIFLAPEGTRSKTGELLPFRSGPFWISPEFKVPIVVVGIHGTRRVVPKGSFWLTSHQCVRATVLSVLPPQGGPEELKARARDILSRFLNENPTQKKT